MINYLKKIHFFNDAQFGFREGLSTEDALLSFSSIIFKGLDDKKFCAGLFVDITKAFDMVDHDILVEKLYLAGFRSFILCWLSSYLKNRTQIVKINNHLSDSVYINKGVPQGSVLGPIFFLIFINSLFSQRFRGKPTAFADDLGIAYDSSSALNLLADINHDISLLSVWLLNHKLLISNKTKLMFFSIQNSDPPDIEFCYHSANCKKFILDCSCQANDDSYSSNNILKCGSGCFAIEIVSKFKYLGVFIDHNLNWIEHINYLKQHFRVSLRHLFLLKKYLSTSTLKSVYFALFHSRLQYGIPCWGGTYSSYLQNLLVLQKKAIRLLGRVNRFSPSMTLFRNMKILPVKHLFYFKVLKVFFIKSGYLQSPITESRRLRSTSANKINIPSFRTHHFRNSYTIVARKLFNRLPLSFRLLNNTTSFLKQVKHWLLNFNHMEIKNVLAYTS